MVIWQQITIFKSFWLCTERCGNVYQVPVTYLDVGSQFFFVFKVKSAKFENFNYLNVACISYKLTMWN